MTVIFLVLDTSFCVWVLWLVVRAVYHRDAEVAPHRGETGEAADVGQGVVVVNVEVAL